MIKTGEVRPVLVSRGISKLIKLMAWWVEVSRLNFKVDVRENLRVGYHAVSSTSLSSALDYSHLNRINFENFTRNDTIICCNYLSSKEKVEEFKISPVGCQGWFLNSLSQPTFL